MLRILITFICICPFVLFSQSGKITGVITDAVSKEYIFGANIVVLDKNIGTSSGKEGTFVINNIPVGSYRIEVSFIGYLSQFFTDVIVRTSKPAVLKVELKPQAFETESIVVTAGYFNEEKLTQPSVISLQREEIRRFPGGFEDIVRTVTTLPGVNINPAGGRNDLLVRGGGPSENLYIVNNIEVPNINHFNTQGSGSGSLSFINTDFVSDVKFSSGGFPARYGEKMSSILELNLAEGRKDQFGGKGLISATQFGLNIEGPVKESGNFIFSARKSYLDLIFKAAGLPFIPVYTDYNFVAHYKPSSAYSLCWVSFVAIDEVDRNLDSPENRTKNARLLDNRQNQYINGINFKHLNKNGYNELTFSAVNYRYRFSQANNAQVEYFNSKADEKEYAIKVLNLSRINYNLNILYGFTSKFLNNQNTTSFADTIYDRNGRPISVDQLEINSFQNINRWLQKYAAFFETDWDINHHLDLNIGLRFDYYNFLNNPLYTAPRIGLKYQIDAHQSLKLNYGDYYQAPSNVWLVNENNKNLKALRNRMSILSWDYLIQEDLRFTAELYYKNYSYLPAGTGNSTTDYLVITNTGTGYGGSEDNFQSFGYFDLVSAGSGKAYGFELLLQKKFSEIPLYGKASFSLGKSELKAYNGKIYPTQFDQRYIFNLSAGYKFGTKWEASGKFRLFSGLPYTPVYKPSENPLNPGYIQNLPEEYLLKRLATGHHLDLRIDRYFNFENWTLITFIDIQNVYNYKIPIRPQYDFWENKIQTSNSLGILPSIGVSAEF